MGHNPRDESEPADGHGPNRQVVPDGRGVFDPWSQPPAAVDTDVDRAIAHAHSQVLLAEERCDRRLRTRRAVRQLIEARRVQAETLHRFGFDSYASSIVQRRLAVEEAATQPID